MSLPKVVLPGLLTGVLGLAAGAMTFVTDRPLFGLIAGVLALAAGAAGLRIGYALVAQQKAQGSIERELHKVRQSAQTTEASVKAELARLEEKSQAASHDSLTDTETGLFSESFFKASLDSRVAAARRHLRPVAIALIDVVEDVASDSPEPADPKAVAPSILKTLRGADTACRLEQGYFAILLEDTPENGAIWTVERIRRQLAKSHPSLTLWAGVACYPAHAFGPEEILVAAEQALTMAREWRQDRIEVAVASAD